MKSLTYKAHKEPAVSIRVISLNLAINSQIVEPYILALMN